MPYKNDDRETAEGIKGLTKSLAAGTIPDYNPEFKSLSELEESTENAIDKIKNHAEKSFAGKGTIHSSVISEASMHVDILDAVVAAKSATLKKK